MFSHIDRKKFQLKYNKDWLDNGLSSQCEACETNFSLIRRKHHCRLCGLIFCFRCSGLIVDNQRVCVFCFVNYKKNNISNNSKNRVESIENFSERSTLPSFHYIPSLINNNYNDNNKSVSNNEIISRINSLSSENPLVFEEYSFESPNNILNQSINQLEEQIINESINESIISTVDQMINQLDDHSKVNNTTINSFITPWPMSPIDSVTNSPSD